MVCNLIFADLRRNESIVVVADLAATEGGAVDARTSREATFSKFA